MDSRLNEMSFEELQVNGSGIIGALAGGYLGAKVGMVCGLVYTAASNDWKDLGKNVYNASVAGAVAGGCAGAFLPA